MAPRDKFFANHVPVFLHATVMLLLSYARRPDLIQRKPHLARCIFHCSKWPFRLHFVTCFGTVHLCYHDAILTCFATGVKLLISEDTTSMGQNVLQGEPLSTMHFCSILKMTLAMRAVAMGKPLQLPIFTDHLVGSYCQSVG